MNPENKSTVLTWLFHYTFNNKYSFVSIKVKAGIFVGLDICWRRGGIAEKN